MIRFPKHLIVHHTLNPELSTNEDKCACAVPIDQFDSEEFNKNDFGFIRNDISQLARAQSVQEYDLLMKRLAVLKSKGDVSPDMTPEQAVSRVRSRYLQSPNELLSYAEQLAAGDMQKLDEAYRKALADVKPAPAPEPAPAPAAE